MFAALKIHVSPYTKDILDQFGSFDLELRGAVEMKVCVLLCSSCLHNSLSVIETKHNTRLCLHLFEKSTVLCLLDVET
jgi:hypothetical protein